MYTPQQTFDFVLTALRKQGVKSSDSFACLYRGPDGTKCAVGHLLPDNLYKSDMDSSTNSVFTNMVECHPAVRVYFDNQHPGQRPLLARLQRGHDAYMPDTVGTFGDSMDKWEDYMKDLADRHQLVYTPPEKST